MILPFKHKIKFKIEFCEEFLATNLSFCLVFSIAEIVLVHIHIVQPLCNACVHKCGFTVSVYMCDCLSVLLKFYLSSKYIHTYMPYIHVSR